MSYLYILLHTITQSISILFYNHGLKQSICKRRIVFFYYKTILQVQIGYQSKYSVFDLVNPLEHNLFGSRRDEYEKCQSITVNK